MEEIRLQNTNLETLAIENTLLYPPFENDITKYEAEVSNETSNLNILAIPEDERATVKIIGKENLKEGKNDVIIQITAPDGKTKKEYTIEVHRRSKVEEMQETQEQKENQERLEEIYRIMDTGILSNEIENKAVRTSASEKVKDVQRSGNSSNWYFGIGVAIVGFLVVLVISKFISKKCNKDTKIRK